MKRLDDCACSCGEIADCNKYLAVVEKLYKLITEVAAISYAFNCAVQSKKSLTSQVTMEIARVVWLSDKKAEAGHYDSAWSSTKRLN
jgi:hypothetical protein